MGKSPGFYWNKFTSFIVHRVEKLFYNLGSAVATYPWWTIVLCWLTVALSSLGLLNFHQESHPLKLWVPGDSQFIKDTEWLVNSFKTIHRAQYILATAPNVLDPSVLAELSRINHVVDNIKAPSDKEENTWNDVCFKIPIIPVVPFETSFKISPFLYCLIIKTFKSGCLKRSILDLWDFDATTIESLNRSQIIDKINTTTISPVLGHNMEYVSSLGGIERDKDGKIIAAKSVLLVWFLNVNLANVEMHKIGNNAGTEAWASESALAWEKKFLELMRQVSSNSSHGLQLFYESGRSYGDSSESTMFQDIDKLAYGIIMMVIYIIIILSKFNWVEIRSTLAFAGLLFIGMALAVALGLCSLMGIPYGPVHASLPFLILGLGIDDMFVMKGCWDQLSQSDRNLPLPAQIGLMLQHAGVSIVITSFTDVVAFLVGSITILPSLQAFCFYAAVGVTFLFVFSVTFYVAVFVLDVQRILAKRNGIICCITHPDFTPTDEEQKSISQKFFHLLFSKIILRTPVKIIVILFTLGITGFSIDAVTRLEQRFDPIWLVPDNTYFKHFLNERDRYYPDLGKEGSVYIGAINYTEELPKIYSLVDAVKSEKDIIHNIQSWTEPFRKYVLSDSGKDVGNETLPDTELHTHLSNFLFTRPGSVFQPMFQFSGDLKCGKPAPPITVSSIKFRFKTFSGPAVYLPAMHRLQDLVRDADFRTGDKIAFVWARIFANWVTDEIISVEVKRNLQLALVCVMGCTVLLITDIQMCLWILSCVLLTLVNVCGMMQRWGLTVDTVTCVGLELSVGLCVDYAAHVGHTFLTLQGSRHERAYQTVTSIGAAVLYGGGSTFISISMLSLSDSYVFKTFFKIFLLVVVFGLFHGIVLLPVILSLVGPKAYSIVPQVNINAHPEREAANGEELVELNAKEEEPREERSS